MSRYKTNTVYIDPELSYTFSARLSTDGGSARNYALPLDVHVIVWKRNTREIKIDNSPEGLLPIGWSAGKDAFRINVWYNGNYTSKALKNETTGNLVDALETYNIDDYMDAAVLMNQLGDRILNYYNDRRHDFGEDELTTFHGIIAVPNLGLDDILARNSAGVNYGKKMYIYKSEYTYESAPPEETEIEEESVFIPGLIYPNLILEEQEDFCEEPEIIEGTDPDGEPSPFRDLGTEVCVSLETTEDEILELPDNAFILCPTCIPNTNWESDQEWWEKQINPDTKTINRTDNTLSDDPISVKKSDVWLDEAECKYKIVVKVVEQFGFNTTKTWSDLKDNFDNTPEQGEPTISSAYGNPITFSNLFNDVKRFGIEEILKFKNKIPNDELICAIPPGSTVDSEKCVNLKLNLSTGNAYQLIGSFEGFNPLIEPVPSGQDDGLSMTKFSISGQDIENYNIQNPKAIELYSSVELWCNRNSLQYFVQQLPKFIVSAPAALIDLMEEDINKDITDEENENNNSSNNTDAEGETETIMKGLDLKRVFKSSFTNLFKTYGEYQAYFLHMNNGRIRIKDHDDPAINRPFYISQYEQKFETFYSDLKNLLSSNGFTLRNKEDGFKHPEEIKIKFDENRDITNVFAKYYNCPFKKCSKGLGQFIDKYNNEKTLMHYVLKHKEMFSQIGNTLPPWIDFMKDFTYPELIIKYTEEIVSDDYDSCLDNSTNNSEDSDIDINIDDVLEDLFLGVIGSFTDSLEYAMNTLNCRTLETYNLTEYQELFDFRSGITPQIKEQIAIYKDFGQGVKASVNEARPFIVQKSMKAFKRMRKEKQTTSKRFIERLLGKPLKQYVGDMIRDPGENMGDFLDKVNPCNWSKILLDILRCMMQGMNLNTSLKRIAKALMGDLDPASFRKMFVGLPVDLQAEVEAEIKESLETIPWFNDNYQNFNIDDYVTLSKKKPQNTNAYEEQQSPAENPPEDSEPEPVDDVLLAKEEYQDLSELYTQKADELDAQKKLEERIVALESLIENETDSELKELYIAESNNIITNNGTEENVIYDLVEGTEDQFVFKSIRLEQELLQIRTSKNTAKVSILENIIDKYDPNKYEKAAREIITIIGEAYIDVIIDRLSITELKELVDSLPGSDIFFNFLKAALCPQKELLDTWTKASWAALDINPCKKPNWKFPPIPELGVPTFLKVLEVMLQQFIKELKKRLMAALLAFLMKALRAVLDDICKLLSGLGNYLTSLDSDENIFDAIASAYCKPIADSNQFNNSLGNDTGGFSQSSAADTVGAAMQKATSVKIPQTLILDWGKTVSNSVSTDAWYELFVSGESSINLVNYTWELTQEQYEEIAEAFGNNLSNWQNFWNILTTTLTNNYPLLAEKIERDLNDLVNSNSGKTCSEIFCEDYQFGVDKDDGNYTPGVSDSELLIDAFDDLLETFFQSPDDEFQEVFNDLEESAFSSDPYCEDMRDLFLNGETDNLSGRQPFTQKPQVIKDMDDVVKSAIFENLEISYYNDMSTSQLGFFNNLLADKDGKRLIKGWIFDPSHQTRVKMKYIWPNANNSKKEHKNKWLRAKFPLKLLMRISHATQSYIDTRSTVNEVYDDEADKIDAEGSGPINRVFKKIVNFVKRKFDLLISGPIRAFIEIFRIKQPSPTNLFPVSVGAEFFNKQRERKSKFRTRNFDSSSTSSSLMNLEVIDLDVVQYELPKKFKKTPDFKIVLDIAKLKYTSVLGYSDYYYLSDSDEQTITNPNYHLSLSVENKVAVPKYLTEGYYENNGFELDEDGNYYDKIPTSPESYKANSPTGEFGSIVYENQIVSIPIPIDVSRYQNLYDQYTENWDSLHLGNNNVLHYNTDTTPEPLQSYALRKFLKDRINEYAPVFKATMEAVNINEPAVNNFHFPSIFDTTSSKISQYDGNFPTNVISSYFYEAFSQFILENFSNGITSYRSPVFSNNVLSTLEGATSPETLGYDKNAIEDAYTSIGSFGYDPKQIITYDDLLYVDQSANPRDKSSWEKPQPGQMGKSATENERVVFLNPLVYGGDFENPKIYIKPADYGGVLGVFQKYVPEIDACSPRNQNMLFLSEAAEQVGKIENKLKQDKRYNNDPSCVVESPFDLIASKSDLAYLHASTKLIVRTYIIEIFLKCLPVFEKLFLSKDNIDDFLPAMVYNMMLEGLKAEPDELAFMKFYREEYWYLVLEQMVQSTEREVILGNIEKNEKLDDLFTELIQVRKNYRQPTFKDLLMLRKVEKIKISFDSDSVPNYDGNELDEKGEKYASNKNILLDVQYKNGVNEEDSLPSSYVNYLHDLIKSILFSALGNEYLLALRKACGGSFIKFNASILRLSKLKHIYKIYRIYKNNNLAKKISMYFIKQQVNVYLKEHRKQQKGDIESGSKRAPRIADLSKFALNSRSTISVGPKNKIGDTEVERYTNGVPAELYGDVNDFGKVQEDFNYYTEESKEIIKNLATKENPAFAFYVEKYVITDVKDVNYTMIGDVVQEGSIMGDTATGAEFHTQFNTIRNQMISIEDFQERLQQVRNSGLNYSANNTTSISDFFGNAELDDTDPKGYSGTIGIKFGVRLSIISNVVYSNFKQYENNYSDLEKQKIDKITLKYQDQNYDFYPIPLLEYEQDIPDYTMYEFLMNRSMWENVGEDLKCYIDRMCEQPEFRFLTDFCLPIKRSSSVSSVTSFDAYLRAVGKGDNERYDWVDDEDEEWKEKIMSHTRRELRNIFSTFYRSRDLDRIKGNRRKHSWEWLKLNIPDININLDFGSLSWWQRRKIKFGERPFNKYDQYCTDGSLGTLNQSTPNNTLNSDNSEQEGFSKSSYSVVDGSQTPYSTYILPDLCEIEPSTTDQISGNQTTVITESIREDVVSEVLSNAGTIKNRRRRF